MNDLEHLGHIKLFLLLLFAIFLLDFYCLYLFFFIFKSESGFKSVLLHILLSTDWENHVWKSLLLDKVLGNIIEPFKIMTLILCREILLLFE